MCDPMTLGLIVVSLSLWLEHEKNSTVQCSGSDAVFPFRARVSLLITACTKGKQPNMVRKVFQAMRSTRMSLMKHLISLIVRL